MKTSDLTRIAMMTAVLCILAPISIPFGSSAISLSTFALYLMAYILKPKQNIAAVGIYLLLGAAGLPVFAGYLGGISRFVSPNGGYLIGYLFPSYIGAWFISSANHTDAWFMPWHIAPVSHRDILAGTHHRHHLFCRTLVRRTALSSF